MYPERLGGDPQIKVSTAAETGENRTDSRGGKLKPLSDYLGEGKLNRL